MNSRPLTSDPRRHDGGYEDPPPVAKLRLLRQIAADAGVTLAAIKTAIVLLDRVNSGTGRCYPSYDSLARDTKLSRRSVINGVDHLVRRGYFRLSRGGGREKANEYEPALQTVNDTAPFSLSETVNAASPFDAERVQIPTTKGANQRTKTVNETAPQPEKGTWEEPLEGHPQHEAKEKFDVGTRGTRLEPNWQPDQRDRQYARRKGFGDDEIDAMCESFVAHFTNGLGRSKTWVRWSGGRGAWGTWVRNQVGFKRGGQRRGAGDSVAAVRELMADGE